MLSFVGVVTVSLVAGWAINERLLADDMERAAEARLGTTVASAGRLMDIYLETWSQRSELQVRQPRFRAVVEAGDVPTTQFFANELIGELHELHDVVQVGFTDTNGELIAAAGDPTLADIRVPEGAQFLFLQNQPYVAIGSTVHSAGIPVGLFSIVAPVSQAQLREWSRLSGAEVRYGPSQAGEEWLIAPVTRHPEFTVRMSVEAERVALQDARSRLLLAALVAVLASALASLFFARGIVRAVQRIREATEQIGQGDFSVRTEIQRSDEIGDVARAVDEMARLLGRTAEQLTQAEKMSAIGRLAGGIAHDFNNILTVIFGYTECLLMDIPPESALREDVEEVQEAAKRALGLTEQLLAFSRQQVLQPTLVDPSALVLNMKSMLERLIGEAIRFDIVVSPGVGHVRVDPSRFEQVIMNLAINARDAMPEGGQLTIELAHLAIEEGSNQETTGLDLGDYVKISVCDTGIGMDEATQYRIFEPFFTTKERGRGTGFGLAISYGIVSQSGGELIVDSRIGEGTTFTIYLPRVSDAVDPQDVPWRAPERGGSETILLVEDDQDVLKLTERMLIQAGYRVLTAVNAEGALACLDGWDEPLDLLLTDIILPGMDGVVLAQQVMGERPEVRALYMSGYPSDTEDSQEALQKAGVFLAKPFTSEALLRHVRARLDDTST
jgi:signal transduction histidine kinase/ActR/RegA family two-component response regulator